MRVPANVRHSVALVGMRGCGKTTIGRLLAGRLGLPFLDTDELVERRIAKTISQVLTDEGEASFRAYEKDAVFDAVKTGPAVISLGGGAVLDPENVDALQRTAVIVWLTAPVELLWKRMTDDRSTPERRPALTDLGGLEELRQTLSVRKNRYECVADLILETSSKPPDELVTELVALLEKHSQGPA